ncbi:MAG: TrkH family potassium uptake protein [Fidelibacterota bacterium]
MKISVVTRNLGVLLLFLSASMIIPLFFSLYYNDGDALPLIFSSLITASAGILLFISSPKTDIITKKEAIGIVTFGWIVISLFGALPYILSGSITGFTNAYFESVSGFTTTGSSILNDIEALPRGILIWRSLTHWLGGMGIIVLALVILPVLEVGGMNIYKIETPEIGQDRITPRIKDTAKILWLIYFSLTAAEILFLLFGGLSFFEALTNAFGTIPTGGFSPKNGSIAAYQSLYIESVIAFFMFISGINFFLYYQLFYRRSLDIFRSEEVRFYFTTVLMGAAAIVVDLRLNFYSSLYESIRYGIFQVISINSTTGFVTSDFNKWPYFSQFILIILMFIGACPGSTTGAIKNLRIIILLKSIYHEMLHILHPRAIFVMRMNRNPIPPEIIRKVIVYVAMYLFFFLLASLIMMARGVDIVSSISAVATTMGGVGPGLGIEGPMGNFSLLPEFDKWLLTLCMMLGRLEFYAIFILFVPEFWRK